MNRYLFYTQINTSNTSYNSAHLEVKNGIIIYRLVIANWILAEYQFVRLWKGIVEPARQLRAIISCGLNDRNGEKNA